MSTPSASSFANRRRDLRVPFLSPAIVVAAGELQSVPARDISPGGVFLLAPQAPRAGSHIHVEFQVGPGRHFSVAGTVVRLAAADEPPGFAVRFDVPEEVREQIGKALLGES